MSINVVSKHYSTSSKGRRYIVKAYKRVNRKLGKSVQKIATVRIYKTPEGSVGYNQFVDKNGLYTKMVRRKRL